MSISTAPSSDIKPVSNPHTDAPLIVIEAQPRVVIDWAELWNSRELLGALIRRDLAVRYKQTVLGILWAAIQPLLTMVVFSVIFGRLANIPSEGAPYPVFVLAGLVLWMFFSNSVAQGAQSLINQQHLLTRIYFPRQLVPLAAVGGCLMDLAIALVIFAGIAFCYGVEPRWSMLWLPVPVILTVILAAGLSSLFAAVNVVFRDFRFVVNFGLQTLLYLSPVVYPLTMIPERYRWIASLNPLTGIIEAQRSAVFGTPMDAVALALSAAMSLGFLMLGFRYFRATEKQFADIA